MTPWIRTLLVALIATALVPSTVRAQDLPSPDRLLVPASDGTALATDLHLPSETGPFPTLLVRTPYGREHRVATGRWFAAAGYAVVVQDVRGTGGSEGNFVPIVNEEADGLATLDWIVDQPWSDGRVVAWGPSYLGYCAWVLAASGHPALVAIAENAAWADNRTMLYRGGAFRLLAHLPWFVMFGRGEAVAEEEWPGLFRALPPMQFFEPMRPVMDRLVNERFDYGSVTVPVLHLAGLHDYNYPYTLEAWEEIRRASDGGVPQRLVLGPWWHNQIWMESTRAGDEDFGPASRYGFERVMRTVQEWFDRHLERGEPVDRPPVEAFVMGENRWRTFESWPPPDTRLEAWYLSSDGSAADPSGGGTLSRERPDREASDVFVYDPEDPAPTFGGATAHFFPQWIGVRDQREIEVREDVLVYTSGPLPEPLELIGPVRAVIHAATDGPDTDFTAKLVVVRPEGYARIVTEGIVRARFRDGMDAPVALAPGETHAFEIDLGATALSVPAGHRLRLEVSSSNFPKYVRNPNTGEDAMEATEFRAATQTVRHGGAFPSRVLLPVWSPEGATR